MILFVFSSRILFEINDHSTIQEGKTSSILKEDAPEDLACFPLLQQENEDECTSSFLVSDIQTTTKDVGSYGGGKTYFGSDTK